MNVIETYRDSELTEKQVLQLTHLLYDVFSTGERSFDETLTLVKDRIQTQRGTPSESTRFVIWEGEVVIAHAGFFLREIFTAEGPLQVGALWGVCVQDQHRGKDFGALLVKQFLKLIDQGVYPVGLWQTGVPDFYAKLGARVITNPFINAQNLENPQANPWDSESIMIYPSDFPWPDGVIDLNGRGY